MTVIDERERQAFEKWAATKNPANPARVKNRRYLRGEWEGWQARAAQDSLPVGKPQEQLQAEARLATYIDPEAALRSIGPQDSLPQRHGADGPWVCFHCRKVCVTEEEAADHFGDQTVFEQPTPACQVNINTVRRLEGIAAKLAEVLDDTEERDEEVAMPRDSWTQLCDALESLGNPSPPSAADKEKP